MLSYTSIEIKKIKKERKKKTMTGLMNGKSINTINNPNKKMKQNN
jgi:hypothetical protein